MRLVEIWLAADNILIYNAYCVSDARQKINLFTVLFMTLYLYTKSGIFYIN